MRLVLLNLFLLLLPLITYMLVRWVRGHRDFANRPTVRLLLVGLVLVIISLLVVRFSTGADPESVYVPPHMEDGKLVGPHYVAPEDAGDGVHPGDVVRED
ncbi:MAG: DUF6111 family protein [Alphaproteobacteria bacterium]